MLSLSVCMGSTRSPLYWRSNGTKKLSSNKALGLSARSMIISRIENGYHLFSSVGTNSEMFFNRKIEGVKIIVQFSERVFIINLNKIQSTGSVLSFMMFGVRICCHLQVEFSRHYVHLLGFAMTMGRIHLWSSIITLTSNN